MKILNQTCFQNIKFLGEISNNCPNNLLGTNAYKTVELC